MRHRKETTEAESNTGTNSTQFATAAEFSSSKSNIRIVVGPVIGGIVVAGALLCRVFLLHRHRHGQGQRVRVPTDPPPMKSLFPRDAAVSHIDPFGSRDTHTTYSLSKPRVVHALRRRAASRSDLNYGPVLTSSSEADVSTQHVAAGAQGGWRGGRVCR